VACNDYRPPEAEGAIDQDAQRGAAVEGELAAVGRNIRAALEETGWRIGPSEPVTSWHPANGAIDVRFHVERATEAHHVGAPSDPDESARIEWVPLDEVRRLVRDQQIGDGLSLVALLHELLDIGTG